MSPDGPFVLDPDPEQSRVLDHAGGAMLVTGVAGTGKTAVLEERFARLLEEGADPERVVLVVGSSRGRDASRRRLLRRLRASVPILRVVTIQGLAYQIVTERFASLGYREPPAIVPAADQFARVHELLVGEEPEAWPAYGRMLRLHGFADEVRQLLTRTQENLLTPDDIAKRADAAGLSAWRELARFYGEYLDNLVFEDRVDFAGLVQQAARVASEGDPLLDHLLVDDYQDTTLAAEKLVMDVRASSLVVAGNPAGHVFSFQGTTDLPIMRFTDVVTGAERVELRTRHRGEPRIEAWSAAHTSEEHAAIAHELRRVHVHEDVPWGSLAVVVRRQGPDAAGLLRALDDAGIPRWMPEEGPGLAAEPVVSPYVMALQWIARPDEREGLIEAVLTSELARLSPAVARGLLRTVRSQGAPAASALMCRQGLSEEECASLDALGSSLQRAEEVGPRSVLDAFRVLWTSLEYSRRLVEAAERSEHGRRDLDVVVAFARSIERAGESADPSTSAYLEWLDAGREGPGPTGTPREEPDSVRVHTAHGAVGSEFDTVFVAGCMEGNFPSLSRPEPMFDLTVLDRPVSQAERNRFRLEDERRLFRTVLGRAARRVVCTASDAHGEVSAASRSRFVEELGFGWQPAPAARAGSPLTRAEALVSLRRTLADPAAPAPLRLAAVDGLDALGDHPADWWYQRDWTDTGAPLHEQIRVSYSRLDTLENCELQFVLNEELGLGMPSGYHAWVGHLVHTLIDDYDGGSIEQSLEALTAEAERRWRQEEFPSFAVSEAFRRLVTRSILPNWFDAYAGQLSYEHEKRFEFEMDGATVSGAIDRIGDIKAGGFRITDYKTGKAENAGQPQENLQLGIYALAVDEVDDLAPFRPVRGVELAFLRGKKTEPGKVERVQFMPDSSTGTTYRKEMRERLGGLIGRVRDLYEQEAFRPNTQAQCRFCDFKSLCPLWPEGASLFPELERT